MAAREEILAGLRTALRRTSSPAPDRSSSPAPAAVPRGYACDDAAPEGLTDLFLARVGDYRAEVSRCGPGDLPDVLGAALSEVDSLVVPADLPRDWLAAYRGRVLTDGGDHPALAVSQLDGVDAVVTGCAVAIAQTGTIVLDAGPAQGRRALTLVPDHHVCVVRVGQLVAGVPAAVRRLDPRRPLTFVSGPSATSDIELDRVEGVHGPRRLHVVLVWDHRPWTEHEQRHPPA